MADQGRLRRMLLIGEKGERGASLPIRLTLMGIVVAGVLLGIVLALDTDRPVETREMSEIDVTDLIGPTALVDSGSTDMLDPKNATGPPGGRLDPDCRQAGKSISTISL